MVTAVEPRRLVENILSTGELIAVEEAAVAAEVGGRITAIAVQEGSSVVAGETVLDIDAERRRLEMQSERARVSEARQAIGQAEREAKRRRRLHSKNATSKSALDNAETDLAAARSRLAAAEAKLGLAERALRDASVAAPFSGLIARRYVGVGDYVNPGQQLFDLIALDPVEVEFRLSERDSGRVEIGDTVAVRVAPYPDESFSATVTMVSPRIDAKTRTLRVKATLPNAEGRLRPGLFARADLGVSERAAVPMIPEDAVLQRSDGAVVFRMVGADRVERRTVRLGVFSNGMVEAVSGVEIGDRVIVRGQARLIDGSPVEVRRRDGTIEGSSIASTSDESEAVTQ
jgi:membrane fusion protein (multidrug efflux system)